MKVGLRLRSTKGLLLACIARKVCFSLHSTKGLLLACIAGVSIKPGVERGFASETPGQVDQKKFQPANAGDRTKVAKMPTKIAAHGLPPISWARNSISSSSGVLLAEPRFTPGLRLLRRLKADVGDEKHGLIQGAVDAAALNVDFKTLVIASA
jgi:hypothetical protein